MLTAIINQHTWVAGCYEYYRRMMYEPGNPEDGTWEAAHWPIPNWAGGTQTILLLKQHHAVHGVLQSEEYGQPCIFGWEANYLNGWLYERCKYWHGQLAAKGNRSSKRDSSGAMKKAWENFTPEERTARNTPGAKAAGEWLKQRTPEEHSERMRKANASRSPEQKTAEKKKAWETRRRRQAETGDS
jgi:hypothetical protein